MFQNIKKNCRKQKKQNKTKQKQTNKLTRMNSMRKLVGKLKES